MKKQPKQPEVPKVCDWIGCDQKPLRVGGETAGSCHAHHLKLPVDLRRDFLMTEKDTEARAAASAKLADWHVAQGNYCQHRKPINHSTCETCNPKRPEPRRNW